MNVYINPLIGSGALKMTEPENPRSRNQMYAAVKGKQGHEKVLVTTSVQLLPLAVIDIQNTTYQQSEQRIADSDIFTQECDAFIVPLTHRCVSYI